MEEAPNALAAPFDPSVVRFKPAVVSGSRAKALSYVDARAIQDRLDEVMAVCGWQDDYQCLADGSLVCRLRLRIGEDWIVKVDVGGPSEQPDGGDRLKAAFSDALKRAAVKFGIGRYLYRLPSQCADYDPQRRQFVRTPALPATANAAAKPAPQPTAAPKPKPALNGLPKGGQELAERAGARRPAGGSGSLPGRRVGPACGPGRREGRPPQGPRRLDGRGPEVGRSKKGVILLFRQWNSQK